MAPYNDVAAFHKVLLSSKRIMALCGAGLSAASGLPTYAGSLPVFESAGFIGCWDGILNPQDGACIAKESWPFRGAGGLWRNHVSQDLATPEAFEDDPGLVWLFYGYRRHMALNAQPNPGHYALAALAKKNQHFLCLTQNVDGLSPRADHPPEQLRLLHGSLFNIKCTNSTCNWMQYGNTDDPFCPALAPASEDVDPGKPLPLLDPAQPLARIPRSELPSCPRCGTGLQRPGVVWFGEPLDNGMLADIDAWIEREPVDLVLVIGTSAVVHPAASYVHEARSRDTVVATINIDAEARENRRNRGPNDFAFGGDAAELLPRLLEPVIGKMDENGRFAA